MDRLYLDNEAWTVAKNTNVMSKVDIETVSILTKVYADQNRIMKVEDEVANVILNKESRDPNKVHSTLMLVRNTYHGWAVDRTGLVLNRIDNAIKKKLTHIN
jgi:hypothetical protein